MNHNRTSGIGTPSQAAFSFVWKMKLFVEAVTESTSVNFDMNVDDFLLKRDVAGTLGFREPDIVSDIPKICGAYAKEFIDQEINFASNYGLRELEGFYRELLKEAGRTDIFLLHLGWGSGWHGTTVGRMFPDMIKDLRLYFGLGHKGVNEFPKTRKIAISGTEQYPLGWACITPA
jgi:CRISPR type III-A-associated RAMP protein Csm5